MSLNQPKINKKNYAIKSKIVRSDLNPVIIIYLYFHKCQPHETFFLQIFQIQNKEEGSKVLTKSFVQNALKTGVINLSGKGLGTGKRFKICYD